MGASQVRRGEGRGLDSWEARSVCPQAVSPPVNHRGDVSVHLSRQDHTCLHITLQPCPSAPGARKGLGRGCRVNSCCCLEDLGDGFLPRPSFRLPLADSFFSS